MDEELMPTELAETIATALKEAGLDARPLDGGGPPGRFARLVVQGGADQTFIIQIEEE
jgi:hypothetical protein